MSRSRFTLLATVVLAGVLGLALQPLAWPARAFTVFLLVVLPVLAVAQARALRGIEPQQLPRLSLYASSAIMLWLLAIATIVTAAYSQFTARLIGLQSLQLDLFLAWTSFALATATMLYAFGRYFGLQESPVLLHLLPQSVRERLSFIVLSITAGICEELVFRGFLIAALTVPLGSTALAVALSCALFGALHAYQGAPGALRASVLGLGLAIPFVVTGSLLPSVVAHTAIDLAGGLWLVRRLNPQG